MTDRVIREGFPEGWFVQDRIKSGEALLCAPHITFGSRCICLRPGALTTDEWLPTARRIAKAMVAAARAEMDDTTDAELPKAAVAAWKRKFKGSERGGAYIHTHPDVERAVVENHHGINYNGQSYPSLDAAMAAALKGDIIAPEPSRGTSGWRWQFEANGPWHSGPYAPEGVYHCEPIPA